MPLFLKAISLNALTPNGGSQCCNFSFGLATKARVWKGVGQEGSMGVTSHALGSVGKCEGTNLHTPKGVPILRVGIPMDFQIFREQL